MPWAGLGYCTGSPGLHPVWQVNGIILNLHPCAMMRCRKFLQYRCHAHQRIGLMRPTAPGHSLQYPQICSALAQPLAGVHGTATMARQIGGFLQLKDVACSISFKKKLKERKEHYTNHVHQICGVLIGESSHGERSEQKRVFEIGLEQREHEWLSKERKRRQMRVREWTQRQGP